MSFEPVCSINPLIQERSVSKKKSKTPKKKKSKLRKVISSNKIKTITPRKKKKIKPSPIKSQVSEQLNTMKTMSSGKINPEEFNKELRKIHSRVANPRISTDLERINLKNLDLKSKGDVFIRKGTAENLGLTIKKHGFDKLANLSDIKSEGAGAFSKMEEMRLKLEQMQIEMEVLKEQNLKLLSSASIKSLKKSSVSVDRKGEENVHDSYVGDLNTSLMNKKILENGENKNAFIRRGTLINTSSVKSLRESLGSMFQLNPNVIIPEESRENVEIFEGGLNLDESQTRKIFQNIEASKGNSSRGSSRNLNAPKQGNSFKNVFNRQSTIKEMVKGSISLHEHQGAEKDFNKIIISESEGLNSEEEKEMEKSLIEENISKNFKSQTKKGKNFNETMNNIYEDMDKTFDQISLGDEEKGSSKSEDLETEDKVNILGTIDSKPFENINDRYMKKHSVNEKPSPKREPEIYRFEEAKEEEVTEEFDVDFGQRRLNSQSRSFSTDLLKILFTDLKTPSFQRLR